MEQERSATRVDDATRAEEAREGSMHAAADREPTDEEVDAAKQAAEELDDNELASIRQHHDEMTRRGAEQKGEGRID